MKVFFSLSFEKIAHADLNRQPSFLPSDDQVDQSGLFGEIKKDKASILNRWKKNRKVPTERIYQLGVDVPSVKKK
jgi:hypothetical protein